MTFETDAVQAAGPAVSVYKRLLRTYLDRRPSGIRQKLATALGTHKSFISQVTNPTYRVPLPAHHVTAIMRICHFSAEERQRFVEAYRAAHPGAVLDDNASEPGGDRQINIQVPDFGDSERQREVAEAIREVAARIIALASTQK